MPFFFAEIMWPTCQHTVGRVGRAQSLSALVETNDGELKPTTWHDIHARAANKKSTAEPARVPAYAQTRMTFKGNPGKSPRAEWGEIHRRARGW